MRTCALTVLILTNAIATGCGSKSPSAAAAINNLVNDPNLSQTPVDLTTTIFTDSFENDDNCINQIKNWTTVVLKGSCRKPVLASKYLKYGTYNFPDTAVGAVPDGHRALFFFASGGSGKHDWRDDKDIHLISPPFSLKGLESIQVSFSYLTIGLNAEHPQSCPHSRPHSGEVLKLEACNGTAAECILGDAQPFELFKQESASDGWKTATFTLPITGSTLDPQKPLFLDFHAKLDAGLAPGAEFEQSGSCCRVPTQNITLIEAAAIDKVTVTGTASGGGEGPGGGDPGDGGEGPGGGDPGDGGEGPPGEVPPPS